MRKYNTEAIVLKSIVYKDADKIYTLLAKDGGLITAHAKGVRKISSKRAGNLDTLNYVKIKLTEQQTGWKTISEVALVDSFKPIKESLLIQSHAFYLIELAYRLLKEDSGSALLFDKMLYALGKLSLSKSDLESFLIINWFEIFLLKHLGYQIELDSCAICSRAFDISDANWKNCKLSFSNGGFICQNCFSQAQGMHVDLKTVEILHSINSGFTYKPTGLSRQNVFMADDLLKLYIKNILEDGFRTERVFKSIKDL